MPTVFLNLYRQGHYHRAGKPGTLAMHPGDLYATREEAIADIDADAPYVGTVPLDLAGYPADMLVPYPAHSTPRPLRETRQRLSLIPKDEDRYATPLRDPEPEEVEFPSVPGIVVSRDYRPAHGGYPGDDRCLTDKQS